MDSVEIPENKRLLKTYLFDKSLARFSCVTFFLRIRAQPGQAQPVPAQRRSRSRGSSEA